MAWIPATDDETPAGLIEYDVHVSTEGGFIPAAQTLRRSVVGASQASITGLLPGTEYHVLVVARDRDGGESPAPLHRSIVTPSLEVITDGSTPLLDASSLNLGAPLEVTTTSLVFPRTVQTVVPAVGSILFGTTDSGGYLRRVDNAFVTSSQVVLSTSSASLSDAVRQVDISSNQALLDVNAIVDDQSSLSAKDGRAAEDLVVSRARRVGDAFYRRIEWRQPAPLLWAEEIDYFPAEHGARPKAIDLGAMTVDVSVAFEPEIELKGSWSLFGGIESGAAIARGRLSLSATAQYDFASSGSVSSPEVTLFRRSWLAVYSVGPAPVLQRVTLEAVARASATASTEVRARASAHASSNAEFGARYDPGSSSWKRVSSVGFDRGMSASLDVTGAVSGEIVVIPRITITAYETAAVGLSLESTFRGDLTVENTSAPACSPLQVSTFDGSFDAECFASVAFTVFNRQFDVLGRTRVCGPFSFPLFGLPQLALGASGLGTAEDPVVLQGDVVDGTNNRFRPSSVRWEADPATGDLRVLASDPPRASFVCAEEGIHTFMLSGFGVLGEPGRQCVEIEHACQEEECMTGTWQDNFAITWNLAQTGTSISGAASAAYECGQARDVTGSFDGTHLTLFATGAPAGCCDWRYDGTISACQSGSGSWVQIGGAVNCTASGTWSMSKTSAGFASFAAEPETDWPGAPVTTP